MEESFNCIVFWRDAIRKEAQAILGTLVGLCIHSGKTKSLRSSVDSWVTFYLNSVLEFLSWWRWWHARARLESLGVTTRTLQELKADWLLLTKPRNVHVFYFYILPTDKVWKEGKWGDPHWWIPFVLWTAHRTSHLDPLHFGEREQKVMEQVNLNYDIFGPEQLDSDTGGCPVGSDPWIRNLSIWLNQFEVFLILFFSVTKEVTALAIRCTQAPKIYLGKHPPSFGNSSENQAECRYPGTVMLADSIQSISKSDAC